MVVILRLDREIQKALKTLDSRLRENDDFYRNRTLYTDSNYLRVTFYIIEVNRSDLFFAFKCPAAYEHKYYRCNNNNH